PLGGRGTRRARAAPGACGLRRGSTGRRARRRRAADRDRGTGGRLLAPPAGGAGRRPLLRYGAADIERTPPDSCRERTSPSARGARRSLVDPRLAADARPVSQPLRIGDRHLAATVRAGVPE